MSKRIPTHVINQFVPEDGITALDLKEKLQYLYVDVISKAEIEASMQAALERGDLILGEQFKLFQTKAVDVYMQTRISIKIINEKMDKLRTELKEVQDKCDHKGNLTYKLWGSSGNWDRADDCYGMDWRCEDCGKTWHTSQDDIWNLTNNIWPNAKRRDK